MRHITIVSLFACILALCGQLTPTFASNGPWWSTLPANGAITASSTFSRLDDEWKVTSGTHKFERDPGLGTDVVTVTQGPLSIEGQTRHTGDYEVRVRLRMRQSPGEQTQASFQLAQGEGGASLGVNLSSHPSSGNSITASATLDGKALVDTKVLGDNPDWGQDYITSTISYNLRAFQQILPGWDVDYRTRIEDAMSRLTGIDEKWVDLRIECRKGFFCAWLDDRAFATSGDPKLDPQGRINIELGNHVQLACVAVKQLAETDGFQTIPLAGYANGHTILGKASIDHASLPPAGQTVTIDGIPFEFAGINQEGNDHLDISQSFLRQANAFGCTYSSAHANGRWQGAAFRDPARIQVRVPNGMFDAIYVIAASDGRKDTLPSVSAMFYRPDVGYPSTFTARVPFATAKSSESKPLPVRLSTGKKANLWLLKIPIDPAQMTAFSDMNIVEIEFTKGVHLYRTYPDPIGYSLHQGGLPSGVHIYAATLSQAPVVFKWNADSFGHVWTAPQVPAYTGTVTNQSKAGVTGKITVTTRSYDGSETSKQEQPIIVRAGETAQVNFSFPVKLNGYHDISATLDLGGKTWTEKRSFVRLAPDIRSTKWTEGKGAMFGYWSYHGLHYTPKADHHVRLMTMAGARAACYYPDGLSPDIRALTEKHWSRQQNSAWNVTLQAWAGEDNPDPAKIQAFKEEILKNVRSNDKRFPDQLRPDVIYFFAEPHISQRLTAGVMPEYWGDPPFQYTDEEKQRLRLFMETSRIAAETFRKEMPDRKILIPWGDPGFAVPLLRAGFPKDLIDGSALDVPVFERLPEMQLAEFAVHRLYTVRKEYEKAGIADPHLQYCEGAFVPTEPGAVTWREQMDIYNRWALLNMAYGVKRFYSGWFAFDCGDYYGAEHYGGCGIQRRIPYCDPKPAYAAYATMTDKLNEANFDGWVKTGSLSTYCLRFKHETRGSIYTLWTIRGKRPVVLTLSADATVRVTDTMNNTKEIPSRNKQVTITTDPSVVYITGVDIVSVDVSAPDNSEQKPSALAKQVADLGDGSWRYTSHREEFYETNHWHTDPAMGRFSASLVKDPEAGQVLASKLEKQDVKRELMPWYNTLVPSQPVVLPYAPSHIGLWVKGASDWGRVIYVLRDEKGERWTSIGTKDDYNCDDMHSWSSFNFDGWRYLRFELPGHLGYDNYRKSGTTWWGSDFGDGTVDLPLKLEEIIVEQRTHILYVNDVQPAASDTVQFGKMYVEYASQEDATKEAVRQSRLRMPAPSEIPNLPNPIEAMTREGVGAPPEAITLTAPEYFYDGTRMHVHFTEISGAKTYHLWVGAYPDGRGAVNLVPAGVTNNQLVTGLRPGIKLYYWLTYIDANGRMSKPSQVHEEITVDNFKEK